ncbi:MAG: tetratricopeptide repeat protein [Candidatus Methylomirabilales bacterium]
MRCIVAAMVLAAVTLLAPPALASQNDGRLDVLFARLRTTDSAAEATAITREIWAIWQQSESDTVNVLMAKGIDEMSRGNYGAALDVFTQMVEAEPNFAEGWNKRATVYYLIGEFDASVRDIDRTLALEPRHFGALSGLGFIYLSLGNERAALKAFEKALRFNPYLPGARTKVEELRRRLHERSI